MDAMKYSGGGRSWSGKLSGCFSVIVYLFQIKPSNCFQLTTTGRPQAPALYSHNYDIDDQDAFRIPVDISAPFSRTSFLMGLVTIPVAAQAAALTPKDRSTAQREKANIVAQQESISGFVAGATLTVTKTLVKYPLDTATVRLQMPGSSYSIRNLDALLDGSYTGILSPLASNIPAGAVFFAIKDAVKSSLSSSTDLSRWSKTCIAVAAAQIPYWLVRNPSEVVKTRQQAGLPGYVEVGALKAYERVRDDRIRQTNATGLMAGLDAFYSGYLENMLYAYPADVIKFLAYDSLTHGRKNLPPAQGAAAGAAATAIAQLVTTPLDVVRNRIMAEKQMDSSIAAKSSYTESLVQLAREEGIAGLFAGSTPRFGKAMLSGAIQFATYEETKNEIAKLFKTKASL